MKDIDNTVLEDEEVIGSSPTYYALEDIDNSFFVDSANAFSEDHFQQLEKSFEMFSKKY